MFCKSCGAQIPDDSHFCNNCGAAQTTRRKKTFRPVTVVIVCVLVGCLLSYWSGDQASHEKEEQEQTFNGWYEENGKRYYAEDGLLYVGFHELEKKLHYFYEDGSLAVNADITDPEYEGITFKTDRNGRVNALVYDVISGRWAEENYRYGYSGSSSVMELSFEVEDCESMMFYIEASGNYGAKTNGNWNIYIRHNGTWEFVEKVNFQEPSKSFYIKFDSPKTFDAITAHPTIQGNASYSALFYLKKVHCKY